MSAPRLLPLLLLAATALAADPRIEPRLPAAPAALTEVDWPPLIAAHDPGSRDLAWAQPDFDDRAWKTMRLPVHFETAGLPGHDGVVWFRKAIEIPAAWTSETATLSLGPIDDMDVTWINGVRVGGHERAGDHFTPREYRIPPGVLQAGRNLIAIRVMDHGWQGGVAGGKPRQLALRAGTHRLPLAGPWRYRAGATLADLWQRPGNDPPSHGGFGGRFELVDGDVVVFAGGTETVKQAEAGHLELLLTLSQPETELRFRSVAWQADTVYERQRPRNFGGQRELLDRIHASVIVCAFGQMESMDGPDRIPEFVAAYGALLDGFAGRTKRVVLLTPRPFARRQDRPELPDLTRHNEAVAAYGKAIRELAATRGFLCVDLGAFPSDGLTTDGLQLTPAGHWRLARAVAEQLTGAPQHSDIEAGDDGALPRPALEATRQHIVRKNKLWRQHWRPTNWAFAFGNRTHVPASHDHRPGQPRWLPKEIDGIIPLIGQAEDEIRASVNR